MNCSIQSKHNEDKLNELGGLKNLEKSLHTNFETGIIGDEKAFEERRILYGRNEVITIITICQP